MKYEIKNQNVPGTLRNELRYIEPGSHEPNGKQCYKITSKQKYAN